MDQGLVSKRVKVTMTLSTGEEVPISTGKVVGVDESGTLVVVDNGRYLQHYEPFFNVREE